MKTGWRMTSGKQLKKQGLDLFIENSPKKNVFFIDLEKSRTLFETLLFCIPMFSKNIWCSINEDGEVFMCIFMYLWWLLNQDSDHDHDRSEKETDGWCTPWCTAGRYTNPFRVLSCRYQGLWWMEWVFLGRTAWPREHLWGNVPAGAEVVCRLHTRPLPVGMLCCCTVSVLEVRATIHGPLPL